MVPDASVGLKWLLPETDSEAAARLLDLRFVLHIPAYFYTEAGSVLQRKVAVDRTLTESEALDAYRLLGTIPMSIHATDDLLEQAILLGIRYRRPVYDSLYLVVAEACGGKVVTADARLCRGAKGGPLDHLVHWVADNL